MKKPPHLILEVLSGPLDGAVVRLQADAQWSRAADGLLAFPWDDELGMPQARLVADEQGWSLESVTSPHGTYRANQEERVEGRIQLAQGDVLKASRTWLVVRQILRQLEG